MSNALLKISIVIRNYNYGHFLGDAIDSALAQTHPTIEVIVVDDGSTDDSRAIIERYGNSCRTILQDNGGEGSAVNAGFAAVTGAVVVFLDSDDVLSPDAAAEIAAVWSPDVTRVHFPLYVMSAGGTVTRTTAPPYQVPELSLEESLARFGLAVSGSQSGNAYAAWALSGILPIDETAWSRACDCYLNALTMAQGATKLIQRPLGCYRIHAASLSFMNVVEVPITPRVVRILPQVHDAVRAFVGEERWRGFRPSLPSAHWLLRILSYRLNPAHPYAEDRLAPLTARCASAIVKRPECTVLRRAFLMAGMVAAVGLPKTVLQKLLPWMLRTARRTSLPRLTDDPARHWRRVYGVAPTSASG